jgi:hypothetical protein
MTECAKATAQRLASICAGPRDFSSIFDCKHASCFPRHEHLHLYRATKEMCVSLARSCVGRSGRSQEGSFRCENEIGDRAMESLPSHSPPIQFYYKAPTGATEDRFCWLIPAPKASKQEYELSCPQVIQPVGQASGHFLCSNSDVSLFRLM